jgi:hypothetical protein
MGETKTMFGLTAHYSDEELVFMKQLAKGLPATKEELILIHEAKALLGATILEDELEPHLLDPSQPRIGASHRDAGDTESGAALAQLPKSGTDRRKVLNFIGEQGERGATDEELSLGIPLRLYTAAPRRNELRDGGWVVDSGRRRPTTTGTAAIVWVLSPAGRGQWKAQPSFFE